LDKKKDELSDWIKGEKITVEERVAVQKDCGREGIRVEDGGEIKSGLT